MMMNTLKWKWKPDFGDAEYKLKMNRDQMEKINSAED